MKVWLSVPRLRFTLEIIVVLLMCLLCSCTQNNKRGGICISFDDRSIKEWHDMRELLNQHKAKVTFFVCQFDLLTTREIKMLKELSEDGHEIALHGAIHVQA